MIAGCFQANSQAFNWVESQTSDTAIFSFGNTNYSNTAFYEIYVCDTSEIYFNLPAVGSRSLNVEHQKSISPTNILTANDTGVIQRVSISSFNFLQGSYGATTFSGITSTTVYTITHGLGYTPVAVFLQPRSDDAAERHYYVTGITATTFDIVFTVAPATGTNNLIFDWFAIK